jgi:iron complex outermembrane receptor protein
VNLTEITTSGFDLNAAFRAPRQSWGTVGVRFNGTYLYKWDQRSQGGDIVHLAGEYGGGVAATVAGSGSTGGFPRWKHTAAVTLGTGPFLFTLTELYVLGYRDADGIRRVGSFDTYGLNLDFTGIRNLTLSAGVKNVLDREPPYTRQNNSFQIGYDPSLADPTGRFYYASVRFRFK